MRISLLLLGSLLILQTIWKLGEVALSGTVSFEALGQVLDTNLVRPTCGLCAIAVAGLLDRRTALPGADRRGGTGEPV